MCKGSVPLTSQKQTANMAKTSINIQPVKSGSEAHNLRQKKLDYVNEALTPTNESYGSESIQERRRNLEAVYELSTGQRMQKTATPIREGVVVINAKTTKEELHDFTVKCMERFGIMAFQIHIHRDEGYMDGDTWKPNLHAHIVFDWTDVYGKTLKLKRQDMAEMQTILAESLKMERGKSSDIKHLNAIQFKAAAEQARLAELEKAMPVKKAVLKASERFSDFMGVSPVHSEIIALKQDNEALKAENKLLAGEVEMQKQLRKLVEEEKRHLENDKRELRSQVFNLEKEIKDYKQTLGKNRNQGLGM